MTKSNIEEKIKKNNVKWIQLHFTDLIGRLRTLHMPSDVFIDKVTTDGIGFDGSSVGFAKVEKSDMIVKPDPDSFMLLPH